MLDITWHAIDRGPLARGVLVAKETGPPAHYSNMR